MYYDYEKREKIIKLEYANTMRYIEEIFNHGKDYISFEEVIENLREGAREVQKKFKDYKNGHIAISVRNLYGENTYIEYWIGRLETDEEFNRRMKELDEKPKRAEEKAIKYVKEIAEKYGYKVEKL